MNIRLILIANVILLLSFILFYISYKQKKILDDNATIKGILVQYRRFGKYLHPIIEFTENEEKKVIHKGGIVNYKPIKIGNEVKMVRRNNGKYLTDIDIKYMQYYAMSLVFTSLLLFFISFCLKT